MSSSVTSFFDTTRLVCPKNASSVSAELQGACSMNIDSVCLPQITPQQAMTASQGCSSAALCGAPRSQLFVSTNVPYSVGGIAVQPLMQLRQLPGV
jgi:hypothetical protein